MWCAKVEERAATSTTPMLLDPLCAGGAPKAQDEARLLRVELHTKRLIDMVDLAYTVGHKAQVSSTVNLPARARVIRIECEAFHHPIIICDKSHMMCNIHAEDDPEQGSQGAALLHAPLHCQSSSMGPMRDYILAPFMKLHYILDRLG